MRTKRLVAATLLCLSGAVVALAQSSTPPPPDSQSKDPSQASNTGSAKTQNVQRVVVGGAEQMGRATKRLPPHYPDAARKQHIEGTVRLDTVIDTDGRVIETKYISGPKELVQASVDCVRQWRFKPVLRDGTAVQAECVFELNFNLAR